MGIPQAWQEKTTGFAELEALADQIVAHLPEN